MERASISVWGRWAAGVTLCAALCLPASGGAASAAPAIACRRPVHDFGSAASTQRVTHTFTLWNDGQMDLIIKSVRECCGATAEVARKSIPPGSNTMLRVSLPLAGREGKQRKSFYVISNDPARPYCRVALEGTVMPAAGGPEPVAGAPEAVTAPGGASSDARARSSASASAPLVVVEYFYEAGCPDCRKVRQRVLPGLTASFGGLFDLALRDLDAEGSIARLLTYQEWFGVTDNEPVCMVVDHKYFLNGLPAIATGLLSTVTACLDERRDPNWRLADPALAGGRRETSEAMARTRFTRFTWSMVAAAGLLDGINPCAASALVFFVSLLAVSGVSRRRLVWVGAAFCVASMLAYMAIGFGLLHVLYVWAGFDSVRRVTELWLAAILVGLAGLSVFDACRYSRGRDPNRVVLRLPASLQLRIHMLMRRGVARRNLVLAGLAVGAGVTILESVCTGQVYVPVLVVVARSGAGRVRALGYLLLYNVMFVLPLVIVFGLSYGGLTTMSLLAWSRKNVVFGKVLLAVLFLLLAGVLAAT